MSQEGGGVQMSGLKAYCPYSNRDGYYHKSDVDKVIADLEESHKREVEQLLLEIVKLKDNLNETREWLIESQKMRKRCADGAIKQLRHQKYKRCRANAKWCHDMWFLLRFDKEAKKSVFFWRWWNIWLEIADKFKEAK